MLTTRYARGTETLSQLLHNQLVAGQGDLAKSHATFALGDLGASWPLPGERLFSVSLWFNLVLLWDATES